jgi:hypothetical protein
MATVSILLDRPSASALKSVSRLEVIPADDHPGYFYVTDTAPGNSQTYIATSLECNCGSYTTSYQPCQHIAVVKREALALLAYTAEWDRRAIAQQFTWAMSDVGHGAARRGRWHGRRGMRGRASTGAGWRAHRRWYATHEPLNASPWDYPRGER